MKRIRFDITENQWGYVLLLTFYLALAGAMAGNWWVGLLSFPFWFGLAVLGRNT
jgi:hypothetical protein